MARKKKVDPSIKIKCFKVTQDGAEGFLLMEDLTWIEDDEQIGAVFHIEVIEMTRGDLDALPDFDE